MDGEGGGAGGGWRLREVLSQDSVLQRFVEQLIFEDVVVEEIFKFFSHSGVGSNSVSGAEPRGALRQKSDVGLVAPFSDMIMLLALSHGNLDIISASPVPANTCHRIRASVYGNFWKNFLVLVLEGVLGS